MTKSEVKIVESSYPLTENESYITYADKFMNIDTTVGFHFFNDSLIEAGYVFQEPRLELSEYHEQYLTVKQQLNLLYGKPVIQNCCRDFSENDICSGLEEHCDSQMSLIEWLTSRSIIRLLFIRDQLSTEFGVLYLSRQEEYKSDTFQN